MTRKPLVLVLIAILFAVGMPSGTIHQTSGASESATAHTAIDILLVLDVSASMKGLSGRDLSKLVEAIQEGNRFGIICFSRDAEVVLPVSPVASGEERAGVMAVLEGVRFDGSHTDLTLGLREALDHFAEHGASPRKHLILVSDGRMYPPPERGTAGALVDELRETVLPDLQAYGVVVHSVAYGNANILLMHEISGFTGGFCLVSPGLETLGDALTLLADHLQPVLVPITPPSQPSWLNPLLAVAAAVGWLLVALLAVLHLRRHLKKGMPRTTPAERQQPAHEAGESPWHAEVEAYAEWRRIDIETRSRVAKVLKLYDLVEEMPVLKGNSFNAELHKEVGSRSDGPKGIVLEVRRRGLLFKPRKGMQPVVLEKAEVIVGSG